ncbi:MAG: FHA domain-containing protein [Rhodopirellula sp.]|nr:FHA domain-containing protein [Rhodopirellula sp.]
MQVTLFVRAPRKPEKRVVVESDVVIGRGKDCNLRVLSNDVSRQHCRLVIGESHVAVRDLGSGNGTQLNGQQVEPNVDSSLISGDIVRIGPLVMKVEFEAAPVQAAEVEPVPAEAAAEMASPLVDAEMVQAEAPAEAEADEFESEAEIESEAAVETIETVEIEIGSETEQLLEPVVDDEADLLADEELIADEFVEAEPAELAAAESNTEDATEFDPPPGKMKSLFGRFRKKDKVKAVDAQPEPTEPEQAAPESAPPPLTADADHADLDHTELVDPDEEPLLVADNADFDQETVVFDRGNALTPEEDEIDLLSDEGDYLDDEIEEEPVDPGFADFLNNVDQPPD